MKSLLFYLLQVVIVSGILYAYYYAALRNKKFHQYNRFYILAAALASILIPFLNIPVYFTNEDTSSAWLYSLQNLSGRQAVIISMEDGAENTFNWQSLWYVLYAVIGLLGLTRVLLSIRKLKKLIRVHPTEQLNGIRFINTAEPGTPFSFFSWLFWNNKIELDSQKGEQIFRHEVFHIQQKHSLDIIFMEIVTIIFWINPVFHLMKKELKAIHEFLADRFATNETQKWEYAEMLLMQALNTQHQLVHPFFHNQIKRRIAMITNPHKTSHQYLRKLLVLPLAALLVTLFAFSYREKQSDALLNETRLPEGSSLFLSDTIPANARAIEEVKLQEVRADVVAVGKALNNNGKKSLFPGLIIFNGKEYTKEEFSKMTGDQLVFESKSVISTSANDPKAIAKYGEKARNGVVEFVGATIDTTGPKKQPVRIVLRGTSAPDKEPLIILDGKEVEREPTKSALAGIEPDNIESIRVLKDSAATLRYGTKAENGVLEITTKKTLKLSPVIIPDNVEVTGINVANKRAASFQADEIVVQGYATKADKKDAELKEVTVVGYGKKKTDQTNAGLEEVTVVGHSVRRSDAVRITGQAIGVQQSPSSPKTEKLQLEEVTVSPLSSSAVVYPNPASNTVMLKLNANEGGDVIIRILDMSGKERLRTKASLIKGTNTTSVSTESLTPGTYIIRVDGQKQNLHSSFKLLKE
ncbi:MAG: T9SS type A sorting domain-containing protein [Chitinophagaceae bacterium]